MASAGLRINGPDQNRLVIVDHPVRRYADGGPSYAQYTFLDCGPDPWDADVALAAAGRRRLDEWGFWDSTDVEPCWVAEVS